MPVVLSPKEWGARVDYDAWTDRFTPDDGVALHHGGGVNYPAGRAPYNLANEIAQVRGWEGFHLGKGWRGIGYGFGVGQTGTIFRMRGFGTYGAHTGDVDGDGIANNTEIVPIIWVASGNHHKVSDAAADSINWLRRTIIEPKSPKALYLFGHQELKGTGTTCPGPNGMDYVRKNRLALEPPMLTPEQTKALDWVIATLKSTSADEAPWGKSFWEKFKELWGWAPGPISPVSHIQLAFIWNRLQLQLDALEAQLGEIEARTGTVDEIARARIADIGETLAAIHEATRR